MQYKIIVDKQPSTNPTEERKEYTIETDELRFKGDVYDSIRITPDMAYIIRRLKLSQYGVLTVLDEPDIQELTDLNVELFEGNNYVYLSNLQGNVIYAEYLIKSDFTDTYVTKNEMNSSIKQTAQIIELSINQKLEGVATTEELESAIEQTASSIKSIVSKNVKSSNLLLNTNFNSNGTYSLDTQYWTEGLIGDVLDNISADTNGLKWLELYQQNNANYGLTLMQTINPFIADDLDYVFSVYCKADGSSVAHNKPFTGSANIQVQAVLKDNTGKTLNTIDSETMIINNLSPDMPQDRYFVALNIPSTNDLAYIEFTITINVSQLSTFSITKLQLEKGSIPSNYNMETSEFQSVIEQTVDSITSEVSKKVNNEELGTKITQNWESVQIAWNQISQYIQFINAMLQIKDSNNNLLMSLNKDGQYFYDYGTLFGEIGCSHYAKDTSQKGLHFGMNPNGRFMSWGKQDTNDSDFYAKMYYCADNSFGNIKEGIYFDVPIFISDKIRMERGDITGGNDYWPAIFISDDITEHFVRLSRNICEFYVEDNVYVNGYQVQTNTSDGRLKHNIKNTDINALAKIKQLKHRQFIWNKDNKQEQIGYIAQELEQVDENYVTKNPQYDEEGNVIDNLYQVNLLPILATATKAIQELEDKLEEKEKIINNQQELLQKLAEKVGLEDEYNTLFNSTTPKMAKAMKIEEDVVDYGTEIKRSTNFKKATPNKLIITKDGTVRKEKESE